MVHELKIYPEHFNDIANNGKDFEVRKNDRDFASGDCLALNEWIPDEKQNGGGSYTGRYLLATVIKVYEYPEYLQPDYVILSLKGFETYALKKVFKGGKRNAGD